MTESRFIRPLDTLYLRGNRLFGEPGGHGAALMPPWPSVAAGALRSRMLADAGIRDLEGYAKHAIDLAELADILGWPDAPGTFRIHRFGLARRTRADQAVEPLWPLPADLAIEIGEDAPLAGATVHRLAPQALPAGVLSNHVLPQLPVLRAGRAFKARADVWLNGDGFRAWLGGQAVRAEHLLEQGAIWKSDARLGIELGAATRTAAEGRLYTAETVAMARDQDFESGFLVSVEGAGGKLPANGSLRFGGDGRGAALASCAAVWPQSDYAAIAAERRLRIVLATPGLFEHGWRLPGVDEDNRWRGPDGCRARLVAAAVPRHQVVSGWDLAAWVPKPALRAAPVGSVYWLEDFEGEPAALGKLADEGLWCISAYPDRRRRAEGFNNILLAAWPRH